jgi:hypothetical protein
MFGFINKLFGNTTTVINNEIEYVEELAEKIREYKESHYDAITWEKAIDKFVGEATTDNNYGIRLKALLSHYLSPKEKRLQSNEHFLSESDELIKRKKYAEVNYKINTSEKELLVRKFNEEIAKYKTQKLDKRAAFDYYQILIQRIFVSSSIEELRTYFTELDSVLQEYYPKANLDIKNFSVALSNFDTIHKATESGADLKTISNIIELDAGYFMSKMSEIEIFEKIKQGKKNTYIFKKMEFDTNLLRKMWSWLGVAPIGV